MCRHGVFFTKHLPKFTVKCKVMLRLLTDNHVMSERKRLNSSGRCEECTMMVSDSVPHMLFECSSGHEVRTHMWNNVIMSSPPGLIDEMNKM